MLYLWLKVAHLVSLISWMAALLYLPRLYVYHAEAPVPSPQSETFKVMERRLLRGIMNPAMIATWVFGIWLVYEGGWLKAGWLHAKLLLVVVLTGLHGFLARARRDFEADRNRRSPRFYRVLNEVPAVLMLAIVALVVVKPF